VNEAIQHANGYEPPPVVHQYNEKWWFWDETWTYAYGPYETEELAQVAASQYGRWLTDGTEPTADLSHGRDGEEEILQQEIKI